MAGTFMEQFIAGHQAGLAARRAKEEQAASEEDRKLRKEALMLEKKQMDFEDKLKLAAARTGMSAGYSAGTEQVGSPAMATPEAPLLGPPPAASPDTPQFQGPQNIMELLRQNRPQPTPAPIAQGFTQQTMEPNSLIPIETPYGPIHGGYSKEEIARQGTLKGIDADAAARKSAETARALEFLKASLQVHSLPETGSLVTGTPGMTPSTTTRGMGQEQSSIVTPELISAAMENPDVALAITNDKAQSELITAMVRNGFDPKKLRKQPDPTLEAIRQNTLMLQKQTAASGGITPSQKATLTNSLRDDWKVAIAPIVDMNDSIAKIDSGLNALARGNRAAASEIIITAFIKLQDALSVVRESEVARVTGMTGVASRIEGSIIKLTEGGLKMSTDDIKTFAAEAKELGKAIQSARNESLSDLRTAIQDQIDEAKIPGVRIFGDSSLGKKISTGNPLDDEINRLLDGK